MTVCIICVVCVHAYVHKSDSEGRWLYLHLYPNGPIIITDSPSHSVHTYIRTYKRTVDVSNCCKCYYYCSYFTLIVLDTAGQEVSVQYTYIVMMYGLYVFVCVYSDEVTANGVAMLISSITLISNISLH